MVDASYVTVCFQTVQSMAPTAHPLNPLRLRLHLLTCFLDLDCVFDSVLLLVVPLALFRYGPYR